MNRPNLFYLSEKDFIEKFEQCGGKRHWYDYPRGFVCGDVAYINAEAFYLNSKDSDLVIQHELGHLDGKEHTWFGIMSPWGLIRYLTTNR